MDYFYFFFHLALNILREKGICTLITTNYYPTASGAKKLRCDFAERANIVQLINFNEYKIFESALGQHNLITMIEKNIIHNKECKILSTSKKGFFHNQHIATILDGTDESVSICTTYQNEIFESDEKYIRLSANDKNDTIAIVLNKMKKNSSLLGEIAEVNAGIMGGCDSLTNHNMQYASESYVLSKGLQKNDGVFVLDKSNPRDLVVYEKLDKYPFFKSFFKNSDIKRFHTQHQTSKKIIFSAASTPRSDQSTIKDILSPFEPILKKVREINKEKLDDWFLLRRGTAHPYIFEKEKIVCPQRSKINTFGYNEIPWYASADVYYITQPIEGFQLKYILGLLNSKLLYIWLYNKGKRKGETLELYQTPLSEIPIVRGTKAKQDAIVSIVDRIINIKQGNPQADTALLEQEIDIMVYHLYGLSYDEVSTIDLNVTMSKEEYDKSN